MLVGNEDKTFVGGGGGVWNDSTKRKLIRVFLKTKKVDVIYLLETKWKSCLRRLIRSLAPIRFVDLVASCSEGASGVGH